jgi:hypothetical protein
MAAYAVIARIDRVDPHLAGQAQPRTAPVDWPAAEPLETEAVDLVARPIAPMLAERWTALREAWSQTTFYLFHVEGWR